MGLRITKTFIEAVGFSLDNVDSAYPVTNAVDRSSPQLQSRTTDTTQARYVVDLLAVQTDIEVYLDHVNFPTFTYQESANGTSGWSSIGSVVTVEEDDNQGVYRRHDTITMASNRYLGILVAGSQTTTDGASVYKFGTIAIPTSVVELPANVITTYPFSAPLTGENELVTEFADGSQETTMIGELHPMNIVMEIDVELDTPNLASPQIKQLMGFIRDKRNQLYLDINLGSTWQAYLCHPRTRIETTINAPALLTARLGTQIFKVTI